MINSKILDIEKLTTRVKEVNSSISIDKINVEGNVDGSIVVGHGNVVGDHNIIYKVNTLFGAFINLHDQRPSISKRPPGPPPHTPRTFVGRERELQVLEEHIRSKDPALLYGQSGVGKTTLLQKAANGEAAKSMPNGVIYLEPLYEGNKSSYQDVLQRVFDRLFVSEPRIKLTYPPNQGDLTPTSSLLDLLKRLFPKRFVTTSTDSFDDALIEASLASASPLILLDEMDIGQDALNRITRLIPMGAVLAAAQTAPLDDVYESIRVTPLSHEEVIQLFAQKSGIAVDAKLRPMVDQICGILEDTPVAIAAIANWIRHITIEPDETEMLLDGLVQWLASVHPSAQDRVQAAIERSSKIIYGKLDSTERQILTMVATVPGTSVNRDWLESSYGQQTIEKLESLELLHANSPRMRLPEALKEYIQSPPTDWVSGPKVSDTDTVDFPASVSKLEEWREWWLTSPIQTLKDLKQDERYLDLIAGELGNLLGGLEWGFRKQRWEDVINLGQMIDPYLALHGLWDVWGTVLTQIQVAAQNLEDPQRRSEVQAWVLHQLGTREIGIGDRNQSIRLLKGALEMRLRDRNFDAAAYTYHNLLILLSGSNGNDNSNGNGEDPNQKPGRNPNPTILDNLRTIISENLAPFLRRYGGALAGAAVVLALVGVLMQPFLRFTQEADQEKYNRSGQQIEYSYIVDNTGFVTIPGPFLVTDNGVNVRCPDLNDIGNGNASLDWNETMTCTGFYSITEDDVKKGSVTSNATVIAKGLSSKTSIQTKIQSIVIPLDDNYLALSVETQPRTFGRAGQAITIAYIVGNKGTSTLSGPIQISTGEKLPVTCPDLSQSGDQGILGVGETLTCTTVYTTTDADVKNGLITSTIRASAGNAASESQTITIYGIPQSGLTLSVSANPMIYKAVGEQVLFTYSITNEGNAPLREPVSATADGMEVTCSRLTEVGNLDSSLDPGEMLPCRSIYTINQTDIERRSVTINATASAEGITTEPQSITIFFEMPPPALFKSADRRTYRAAGEEVTYTYVVMNQGSAPASGPVAVKDDLTEVKCPDIQKSNDRGMLDPGQWITCTATYIITEADVRKGSVTNTAIAYLGENNSEPQSVTLYLQTEPSNLILTKLAKPETYQETGQMIRYTYLVVNDGKYPLKGPLTVRDEKTTADCPEVTTTGDEDGALDPGERLTCSAVYTITDLDIQNGSFTHSARASMDGVDSNPDSVTVNQMAVNLEMTADRQSYETPGDTISYTYVVTGKSREPLRGSLTILQDNDRIKVDCPAVQSTGNGDNLLDWNETITCTGQYLVAQSDIDTAQPGSDHGAVMTTAHANMGGVNSRQVMVAVMGPVQQRALSLAVTPDPPRFESVDQKITYTYVITNTGNVTVPTPIQITDDRVDHGTPFQCGNGDRPLGPKESITCTGSYTITQDDFGPKSVTNTATASITGVRLPETSSATATVTCQYMEGWIPYIVDPNESLEHISSWYENITEADLRKANCMGVSNTVEPGQTIYVPRQPPSATISGFIRDTNGQPLSNTPVTLINNGNGASRTTYTTAYGEYTFPGLEPGTYRIFQVLITVRRGDRKTQNFTILPGTP